MDSEQDRRRARLIRLDWECRRKLVELHGRLKHAAEELHDAGRKFEGVLENEQEESIRDAIDAIENLLDREYLVHILTELEAERQRAKEFAEKLKTFSA